MTDPSILPRYRITGDDWESELDTDGKWMRASDVLPELDRLRAALDALTTDRDRY